MSTALGIAGLVILGVGLLLILVGVGLAISDARKKEKAEREAAGAIVTEPHSIGETIEGLAKLADSLIKYPLGMQLVFIGVLLVIVGGVIGGIGGLV